MIVKLSKVENTIPNTLKGKTLWLLIVSLFLCLPSHVYGAVPRFFESNRMGYLKLPRDTEVDSIIYRLRAQDTDRDYPLYFSVEGTIGLNLIYIDAYPCTPSTSIFCEADVYLRKNVEVGRIYVFNLTVADQTGFETEVVSRIDTSNERGTPISEIFVRYSPTVRVAEDFPLKSIITSMIVKKRRRSSFANIHVIGPAKSIFKIESGQLISSDLLNGSLILQSPLDFEQANLHTFKVCMLHPFTDPNVDTRNIACVLMSVIVDDVQDEPPVFVLAPPVTRVPAVAIQGDKVAQVEAKDGDRGTPRPLRYSILPASSLYTKYFRMDDRTGIISMNETAVKLRKNMVSLDPILMTVTAEEITNVVERYPALSTSVEIAFVVLDAEFLLPKFVHESYVGEVYEDSLPDTQVFFNSPFLAAGVKGLFTMELEGDKGAFSVQPGVVTDSGNIKIKVKNSFLLDYEKVQQIHFRLVARQITGRQHLSGSTDITVRIIDVNDNVPVFSQPQYEVEIYENIVRGTSVARIYASDKDEGEFGLVRYTNIIGKYADNLFLDSVSGLITIATDSHGFDREEAAEYILTVEAKDNNGQGVSANTASSKLIIRVKDVNDSPPVFLDSIYKGVMAPDLQRLRDPLLIRAVDKDAERPNNEIVYSIMRSSYSDFFTIDRATGRLDVNQNFLPRTASLKSEDKNSRLKRQISDNDTVISLVVRASDLGNPPLSDFVDVKIFKQEYGERVIRFIYPKESSYVREHTRELESTLNALTGGSTEIMSILPLRRGYLNSEIDPYKSDVTALVRFGLNTVIDVEQLMSKLNNSEVEKLKLETEEKEVAITALEDVNSSYAIGVGFLVTFLIIIIIALLLCFFCEGCPLYKASKVGIEDSAGGSSYRRVDESGRRREEYAGPPGWWLCLPRFMQECCLSLGYTPPNLKPSRVAWSGDERERQRHGRLTQPAEVGLQSRQPVQALQQPPPQQPLQVEDVDPSRGPQGQGLAPQGVRIDARNGQAGQEPRRVFVLKDAMGVPRAGNGLRDGSTYLLEDLENQQLDPAFVQQNEFQQPPGNGQSLRLNASLQDAALYNDSNNNQRRFMRSDVQPGGSIQYAQLQNQSKVNGEVYSQDSQSRQSYSKRAGRKHEEEERTPKSNRKFQHIIGTKCFSQKESVFDAYEINRVPKINTANIPPGLHGVQHTKTSILRYESNKDKIEEIKEELRRQGKDPDDFCIQHQGGGVSLLAESKKATSRKLESRRSQSQFSLPSDDRFPLEKTSSMKDIYSRASKERLFRESQKSSRTSLTRSDENIPGASSSQAAEGISERGIHLSEERIMNYMTKESIEKAIAAALVNMANKNIAKSETDNIKKSSETTAQSEKFVEEIAPDSLQRPKSQISVTASTSDEKKEGKHKEDTIEESKLKETEKRIDKNISSEIVISSEKVTVNTKTAAQLETSKTIDSDQIQIKNVRNDSSILNIPSNKRKRKIMEKKSVFTIAYDGVKTDQLRPESAKDE